MSDVAGPGDPREQETCARVEQLTDLIDELTSLREANTQIDARIAALVLPDTRGWRDGYEGVRLADAVAELIDDGDDDNYAYLSVVADVYEIAELTRDFDAAEALVPANIPYDFFRYSDGSYQAVLCPPGGNPARGVGAWPAVAMVSAVLEFMLAKERV